MKKVLSILFVCCWTQVFAQIPTIQDCLGAIAVCQQVYTEVTSPTGDGNYNNEVLNSNTCTAGELNSIWYTFTVDNSGDFGFLITPADLNDDYDWILYNITTATCNNITNNPSAIVSCNAAGGGNCNGLTGATGASTDTSQPGGCGGGNTAFNALIPVVVGNTYALMVSNWSGSTNGYTIDFGLAGNIGVLDEQDPFIENIDFPTVCLDNTIALEFSESIQCATIDVGMFTLEGPNGSLDLMLSSNICDQGGEYDYQFEIEIDPGIIDIGTYELIFNPNNMDQALDVCGNPSMDLMMDYVVDLPLYPPVVDLGLDTTGLCVGNTILLDVTITEYPTTYEWSTGNTDPTILVDQEGPYAVTVTNACGSDEDEVQVAFVFNAPSVDFGADFTLCEGETALLDAFNPISEYNWQDGSSESSFEVSQEGFYSVEVENACGMAESEVFVNVIDAVDLNFPAITALCEGDTLILDATSEQGVYEWSTGNTNPIQIINKTGSYSVTVTTPCEVIEWTTEVLVLDDSLGDLLRDTFLCENEVLDINITIANATYLWEDGSTEPTRMIDVNGNYAVTVVAPCKTFDEQFTLTYIPPVDFDLGEDIYLCESQAILDATTASFVEYLWTDGSVEPVYVAETPDEYIVRVFNKCENILDSINVLECQRCELYVPNVFSPNGDGVNDVFQTYTDCELLDFTFKVYNRWGAVVYETNDPLAGWNGNYRGKEAPMGVYVWFAQFTVEENEELRTDIARGDVGIIR